jgi:hypothetical protein
MPLSAKRVLRTFRYGIYFDGIDDRVLVTSTANDELDLPVFTLVAMVNPVSIPGTYGSVVGRFYRQPYHMYIDNNYSLRVGVTFYDNTLDYRVLSSANAVPLNVWSLLATSYDRVTMRGYINGSLVGTTVYNKALLTGTNYNVYLGSVAGGNPLRGYIYCVMIYNRVLSNAEIAQLYSNPDFPPTSGLVLWLKASPDYVKDIDNDGILEWIDLSGNNNHGKIYGAVLTKVVKDPISVSPSKRILSVVR